MNPERGVAIYLALAILTILLGIGLGVFAIVLGQLRTIQNIGFSTVAFYAADSGIERELLEKNYETRPAGYNYACFINLDDPTQAISCDPGLVCLDNLPSGNFACVQVEIVSTSPPSPYTKIKSIGYYREVRRALEISF